MEGVSGAFSELDNKFDSNFLTHDPQNPGGQTTVALAILVTSVFGPHLMLNLREAYYRPFMEEARGQLSGSLKFQHDGTTVLGASDVLGMAEEQSMDA